LENSSWISSRFVGHVATTVRYGISTLHCKRAPGRVNDAREELRRAFEAAEQSGQHFFDAELNRIGGKIALRFDPRDPTAAERCFCDAIEVARAQEAKWWELRASVSLARLLRDTNRRSEARALLAPSYNWLTEGFDTVDLKDARALVDEMSA
jgi:predicted ATPase